MSFLMLPDFPSVKKELARRTRRALEVEMLRNAPLVAEIKRHRQQEGDSWAVERHDGQMEIRRFKQVSSKMEIPTVRLFAGSKGDVITKLKEVAADMAQQSERMLFTTIREATDATGNVINAGGKPFHPSMMLKMLEKTQIDFDDAQNPLLPTIVIHPDMANYIREKIPEWEADPAIQAERQAILAKKKEEWRDRESNRKLVG